MSKPQITTRYVDRDMLRHGMLLMVLFLFFFQMISDLVESVYTLDLLNTQLDEKALGILFLFGSGLLYFIPKKWEPKTIQITALSTMLFRCVEPLLPTGWKIIFAGLSVTSFLMFFPLYIVHSKTMLKRLDKSGFNLGFVLAFGIAAAALWRILFTSIYASVDISLVGYFQGIGWIGSIFAGYLVFMIPWDDKNIHITADIETEDQKEITPIKAKRPWIAITGLFSILMLFYLAYMSPIVFNRWTEANYIVITILMCMSYGGVILVLFTRSYYIEKLPKYLIVLWNLCFFSVLVVSILVNQTEFINSTSADPQIVFPSTFLQQLPTYIHLLLSPILLIDIWYFGRVLSLCEIKTKKLVGAVLLNELLIVIFIFMFIFTNIWGYVEPISNLFRGLFWLPFLILGGIITFLILFPKVKWNNFNINKKFYSQINVKILAAWLIAGFILVNGFLAYLNVPHPTYDLDNPPSSVESLRIMTFNIQQGVNDSGEKNFESQLALIKDLNPDIIGLQESDTPKINTGNTDVVGFFAKYLDYHVYYGPKSVMQTYGVALLSRYPIIECYSIYSYGNEDEIGSLFAKIQVGDEIFNAMVNHPAGSDDSKLKHTEMMLDTVAGMNNVILLGDFNWRETTTYYTMVTTFYEDTWRDMWTTGIDDNGLNMSSTIDHIFVSSELNATDARYILAPASQTDHPVYWTDIIW